MNKRVKVYDICCVLKPLLERVSKITSYEFYHTEDLDCIFHVGFPEKLILYQQVTIPVIYFSLTSCSIGEIAQLKEKYALSYVLELPVSKNELCTLLAEGFPKERVEGINFLDFRVIKEVELGINALKYHYSEISLDIFLESINSLRKSWVVKNIGGVDELCRQALYIFKDFMCSNKATWVKSWYINYLHYFNHVLKLLLQRPFSLNFPKIQFTQGIGFISLKEKLEHIELPIYSCSSSEDIVQLFKKGIYPAMFCITEGEAEYEILLTLKEEELHYFRVVPLLILGKEKKEIKEKSTGTYWYSEDQFNSHRCFDYYEQLYKSHCKARYRVLHVFLDNTLEEDLLVLCKEICVDLVVLKEASCLLEFLLKEKADLVLLSCEVECEKQLSLLRVIRSEMRYRHLPVILLANEEVSEEDVEKAYCMGVDDLILRPLNSKAFQYRLKYFLQKERRLKAARHEDCVSGLLNREGLNHYFHEFTEGGGGVGSLIILDLDHLKVVNDILGHTIGDQLLFDFGELLCNHFGQGAAISRWGGDEFVVFLAEVRKYRIYELLEDLVFIWKEHCCSLGVIDESIGVSCGFSSYPDEGDSFERLFNVADNYLYQAKKGGRGIVVG